MNWGCETCDNCGLCCKDLDIELSKEDIRTLAGLGYQLKDFLVLKPVPRMKMVKGGNERICVFLDKENICVIHKKHGLEKKPHTCKQYPDLKAENLKGKDYFFYEYGGKVFTRDVLVKILENLKRTSKPYLFEMLLDELEMLKKQKNRYVDFFNYDDAKRPSGFGKSFAKRRVKKTVSRKFRGDDKKEFREIGKRAKLNVPEMIEEMQKRIPGDEALNPNLPEMLLAYFYILQTKEPKDPVRLAKYFFEWNSKRF